MESEPGCVADLVKARLFQIDIIIVIQVIQTYNFMPFTQQPKRNMHPVKPATPVTRILIVGLSTCQHSQALSKRFCLPLDFADRARATMLT